MNLIEKLREKSSHIQLIFLICLFGTGSWVELNGIWVELPLLVNQSPQGWSLPSYLSIVIQIANLGPLFYFLATKLLNLKKSGKDRIETEIPANFIILSVGAVSSLLLAFFWHETTIIAGTSYSTALIVLSFFLAVVDCTSSLTFLPFMAHFPAQYMTVYYIGEGMSGFIPSIAALIQGLGGQSYTCEQRTRQVNTTIHHSTSGSFEVQLRNVTESAPAYFYTAPLFSTRVFFLFITFMMLASLTSFAMLVRIKNRTEKKQLDTAIPLHNNGYVDEHDTSINKNNSVNTNSEFLDKPEKLSMKKFAYLLVANGILSGFSNGVLPSLQSYACLPYSNQIYHMTLILSAVSNPLACFLYFFVSLRSLTGIGIGVLVYLASVGYTIGIAATSPCPILNDSQLGGILVVSLTDEFNIFYF